MKIRDSFSFILTLQTRLGYISTVNRQGLTEDHVRLFIARFARPGNDLSCAADGYRVLLVDSELYGLRYRFDLHAC